MIPLTRTAGQTKDTISWPQQTGAAGFKFTVDGKVSHTWDGSRTAVTVAKTAVNILVEALGVTDFGRLPAPVQQPFWREDFTTRPASWWRYEYNGQAVTWPHTAFSLQPNGEGGTCLNIGSPPGAPGGQGILAAMWNGGNEAHGKQGQEYWLHTRLRFDEEFAGWMLEQHEGLNLGVYSCAIGLTSGRRLDVQVSGGNVVGHNYTRVQDTVVLTPNRWYDLVLYCKWATTNEGRYHVWLDGRPVLLANRPTLLYSGSTVDEVALGLYSYPGNRELGPTYTQWDYLVLGPTKESVGA